MEFYPQGPVQRVEVVAPDKYTCIQIYRDIPQVFFFRVSLHARVRVNEAVGRSCYSLLMERHEGAESRVPCQFPSVKVHLDSGSFHRSEPEIDSTSITVSESVVFFFGGGGNAECIDYAKTHTEQCEFPARLYRLRYGDDRGWSEVKGCTSVCDISYSDFSSPDFWCKRKGKKAPFEITPTASESHIRRLPVVHGG